ncbi:MAG: ATP phosphoribosyltransferase regulatory subunit [Isosphaeraceae bacterium]|nr:ATP phosphoribosyltransferase regulatory subunit [Isosphaeraceae bacterium]
MSVDPARTSPSPTERPIGQVRGVRDWMPEEFARLEVLETLLLDRFARAGYAPLRTPILEFTELHERKSGAGIVAKLFGVQNGHHDPICLRPELTASIVRAYTAAEAAPPLPWRVSMAGPVFRYEKTPQAGHYREFTQVGVELLGAPGPAADAEVIALADWALREAGISDATLRVGHVGLILEMFARSGLPPAARAALVEMLSEAAAEGRTVRALESALEGLSGWLRSGEEAEAILPTMGGADDGGVDRLFRHLVPDITGRRSGHEIIGRLRRKWDLGHSLQAVLDRARDRIHELADLRGSATAVLDRLAREYEAVAPDSVAELRALLGLLEHYGLDPGRIELDLGFSRGIGFYSQMIFELIAPTPSGPVEVCGGGRYDGLARVLGSDRDDRGVGFAFGLERLWHVLEARGQGECVEVAPPQGLLVCAMTPEGLIGAIGLVGQLRPKGVRAVLEPERTAPEAIAHARRLGLRWVVEVKGRSLEDLILHRVHEGDETRVGLARLCQLLGVGG